MPTHITDYESVIPSTGIRYQLGQVLSGLMVGDFVFADELRNE